MKVTIAAFVSLVCLFVARSEAQIHAVPGPSMSVELENEAVSVLRVRLAPHERTAMHELTPRVVVWLTDAHLKDTSADGKVREEHWKAGQAIWVPAQRHAGENLGDRPVEFIAVIPKTVGR
jgi:quercetin dioxygenase-like cupin family protein